jgi:hypothetical protein
MSLTGQRVRIEDSKGDAATAKVPLAESRRAAQTRMQPVERFVN